MRSRLRREGELLIDNTNSPGVPIEMIRATGLDIPYVAPGQRFEAAVIMCTHCNGSVIKNPDRTRDRAICMKCHAYMCDACAALGVCRPFAAFLQGEINV